MCVSIFIYVPRFVFSCFSFAPSPSLVGTNILLDEWCSKLREPICCHASVDDADDRLDRDDVDDSDDRVDDSNNAADDHLDTDGVDDRDDHLRSREFLSARRNPVIVFEASSYVPADNPGEEGVLAGNLTMLGETHPVELAVTVNKQERYPFGHRRETLGISASATIFRSQWGMDYGVSNEMVGDEVKLRFELEALRQ